MHRRSFVRLLAAAGCAPAVLSELGRGAASAARADVETVQSLPPLPALRVVSSYTPAAIPGMPGPYPGRVVSINSDKCVDTVTGRADDEVAAK